MTERSVYRCAIYTRKSHEEGLDQDFNSLDAQYEACKAYIASQVGLGWKLRDHRYDDGGISGGHMDRPALQGLITDIEAGLIDVIVVYKVDRLTRSLTDFAKLVDVFVKHDVSFVSVTQAFNTTTSMGRLTLNVLLSFAQFEREVTAERIRDKFAASKKKGIWMGGTCPYGYTHSDRKLHIHKSEAEVICKIFQLYIKIKNVRLVKAETDRLKFVTRRRTHKSGKSSGGTPFSRGHIYRILSNPLYVGKIQHKNKVYEGEHEAIISKEVWNKVQAIKSENASQRNTIGNSKSNAVLAGLLYDSGGNILVPHHTKRNGRRYSYYVSQKLKTGDIDSGWRLPARAIELSVKKMLIGTFSSQTELMSLLPTPSLTAEGLQKATQAGKSIAEQVKKCNGLKLKVLLNEIVEKICIDNKSVEITFKSEYIARMFDIDIDDNRKINSTKPMSIRRRGQEMKMVIGSGTPKIANPDQALIRLISRAYALKTGLEDGSISSIKDFAKKHNIDHADAKRMLPLGYMAPDIVEAILSGHQPDDLTALKLKNGYKLPMTWTKQRSYLGFPSS